ncbi:hypothetical protein ACHAPT_000717 [Fusarium lateritium]
MEPHDDPRSILESTRRPPKRQRSDSSESYSKVKRQNVQVDEPLPALDIFDQCEDSQVTAYTFETHAILQSSNVRPAESLRSSWDPSPPAPEDAKSDCFDDPDLDQYLDELDESADMALSGMQACQKGDTEIVDLEDSDSDAFTELLDEAS